MKLKDLALEIHLYLGLAAGLVISIVCLTGAILTFDEEIEHLAKPHLYYVSTEGQRLTLDELVEQAKAADPELTYNSITLQNDPARSAALGLGRRDNAYINPYTGEFLGRRAFRDTFMFQVFSLHRWLLAGDTGKLIVGISTIIFLVILITGVWTWWPVSKRQLRERTRISWKSGWKRINFDLHVSLGIFAALILFVLAFTGLAWSFRWFHNGIFFVTGSSQERIEPPVSPLIEGEDISLEAAYAQARALYPNAHWYNIGIDAKPEAPITVRVLAKDAPHDRAADTVYLDRRSGETLGFDRYAERNLGSRVRTAFYPIHVGSIYGLPTRILAFIACILGFTFPITGALVWYNKRIGLWKRKLRLRRQRKAEAV